MNDEETPQSRRRYFYTMYTPFRWSSGPSIYFTNPRKRHAVIESLEEAKELAEAMKVDTQHENRTETGYGWMEDV